MNIHTTTIYKTDDGETFDSLVDAENHVALSAARTEIDEYITAIGITGREASRVRNTLMAHAEWKSQLNLPM